MKTTYKITIEYDGTGYFGWQRQKDHKTIQGELEKTLSIILNQPVKIHGSGRTDAGVHAFGQVAHFSAQSTLSAQDIKKGVNSLIKQPIVFIDCVEVNNDFHAQYSVVSKTYHYHIFNHDTASPIKRLYSWHITDTLDIQMMTHCCETILGTHDFKSFENSGSPRSSTRRTVFDCKIEHLSESDLIFIISANGFLKYMVRNLVGTIVDAGRGKLSIDDFKLILAARDRTKAGAAAPAHGLFLYKVNYS
jgi:tRNA pseudouridine38-40 synthase